LLLEGIAKHPTEQINNKYLRLSIYNNVYTNMTQALLPIILVGCKVLNNLAIILKQA